MKRENSWSYYQKSTVMEQEIRMIEDRHRREKRNLMKQLREAKTDMRALKITTTKMRKNLEARIRIEENVRKELEAVKKSLEEQMKGEVKKHREDLRFDRKEKRQLKKELEALKVTKSKLEKQLELERKNNEEEKGILQRRNQELQQELEALKARVPMNNLQLASRGSESQDQTETNGRTAQPKVSVDSFHPIRILGEGGFGRVLLVKKKVSDGTDRHFAMKVLKKSHIISCCSVSYTVAEKEALVLACGHPFITTLYSCFQTKEHLFFVMEYISGGNMAEELGKVRVFSEERARFYAAEITLALEFLHRYGILHLDLKLDNVLIDGDGHCKVADFGLSKLGVFDGHKIETYGGTPCYMAPEMLLGVPCGQEVDWWALGIIMYAMMAGRFPFSDPDEYMLQHKIKYDEEKYPTGISKDAKLMMRGLLTKDPYDRLGAYGRLDSVREQPFFRGIDWRAVQEKRVKPPQKPKIMKESEENLTFDELLKPDNGTYRINQKEFYGFSFVNHGVPQ